MDQGPAVCVTSFSSLCACFGPPRMHQLCSDQSDALPVSSPVFGLNSAPRTPALASNLASAFSLSACISPSDLSFRPMALYSSHAGALHSVGRALGSSTRRGVPFGGCSHRAVGKEVWGCFKDQLLAPLRTERFNYTLCCVTLCIFRSPLPPRGSQRGINTRNT